MKINNTRVETDVFGNSISKRTLRGLFKNAELPYKVKEVDITTKRGFTATSTKKTNFLSYIEYFFVKRFWGTMVILVLLFITAFSIVGFMLTFGTLAGSLLFIMALLLFIFTIEKAQDAD